MEDVCTPNGLNDEISQHLPWTKAKAVINFLHPCKFGDPGFRVKVQAY